MRIAISARAALPLQSLVELRHEMCGREDVPTVYQLMGLGRHALYGSNVPVRTLFVDAAGRGAPNLEYLPCGYAQAERVFEAIQPDRAILACAMRDGRISWGTSWDVSEYLYGSVSDVLLEINTRMPFTGMGRPYTHGEIRHVDYALPEYLPRPLSGDQAQVVQQMAERACALLPPDIAVQMGVGHLPELVAVRLTETGLPVALWTEAFSDPMRELCESGNLLDGRPTCAFLWGSRALYEWAENACLDMRPLSEVNTGRGLDRPLWSINGALQIDVHGNINAERLPLHDATYSGTGGHLDFARLAWLSGGRSIVALPSRARGTSRIVRHVHHVTTPRSLADLVVTEYGVADLRGASESERIQRMIAIAHPDDRGDLARSITSQ